jgi:hypothetical protein
MRWKSRAVDRLNDVENDKRGRISKIVIATVQRESNYGGTL